MDEVHFQQYGSRCRMWVPPETKDPVLLHHRHPAQCRATLEPSACAMASFFFRRETGKFNALTCWKFLRELGASGVATVSDFLTVGFSPARYPKGHPT